MVSTANSIVISSNALYCTMRYKKILGSVAPFRDKHFHVPYNTKHNIYAVKYIDMGIVQTNLLNRLSIYINK